MSFGRYVLWWDWNWFCVWPIWSLPMGCEAEITRYNLQPSILFIGCLPICTFAFFNWFILYSVGGGIYLITAFTSRAVLLVNMWWYGPNHLLIVAMWKWGRNCASLPGHCCRWCCCISISPIAELRQTLFYLKVHNLDSMYQTYFQCHGLTATAFISFVYVAYLPYPLLWMLHTVSTPEIMATLMPAPLSGSSLHMYCLTDGLPTCRQQQ